MRLFGSSPRWRVFGGLFLLLVLSLAGAAWFKGGDLVGWYCVRRLSQADDADVQMAWQARLHRFGKAALPAVLAGLRQPDPQGCARIGAALKTFPAEQAEPRQVAANLAEAFAQFSPAGQEEACGLFVDWVRGRSDDALLPLAAGMLNAAAQVKECEVHASALRLAEVVGSGVEVRAACRELIATCLRDGNAHNQIVAVRLSQDANFDLLVQVVPLLNDPKPEVRQAALLALGPAPEVLATDDLLLWLHDPDPAVRKLCETALRGRGLPDKHVQLGRFLTDAKPAQRLQVLNLLKQSDLEPGIWLRRLSHDRVPAVRAAAVRAAAEQPFIDLADRLEQMAQDDPSPTVRQLARFYVNTAKPASR